MADIWARNFTIKASHAASQTIFSIFSGCVTKRLCRLSAVWRSLLKVSDFLIMTFFNLFNCNSSVYHSNNPANILQVTGPKS